jgi:sphingomyelin phosphodiesterase acid-like 3
MYSQRTLNADCSGVAALRNSRLFSLPLLLSLPLLAWAARAAPVSPVQAVMLSDIHFDPFHDPAKFARLQAATVDQWAGILGEPSSKSQPAEFAALQRACGSRGIDTPFPLLKSAIAAAVARDALPLFVTVSGDLLAHGFDCKYRRLAKEYTAEEYSRFAARTLTFVALELKLAYPKTPVYLALGNNDSGCEDYRETPNSMFLVTSAWVAAAAAGEGVNDAIAMEAQHLGDWSVLLPKPMHHTRLLVLQDLFESKRYESCPNSVPALPRGAAEKAQIAWLRQQLEEARAKHQTVWVMGHIPPGVDPYSTLRSGGDVCTTGTPEMFLDSESLLNTITSFGDVVKLAIFAHTHMDEMRLLTPPADIDVGPIAMKMVPSISPVNGNDPAFLVASIDPATGTLKDYTAYSAANEAASRWETAPKWTTEYTYSATYHEPDYSAGSVKALMGKFLADRGGSSAASHAYQEHYFTGDLGLSANMKAAAMQALWPMYACSMANPRQADFRRCVCGGKSEMKMEPAAHSASARAKLLAFSCLP